MAKKPTTPRKTVKKPRKRGPTEERLVIREDPAEAIARLLKAPRPKANS
jgi:hypothetical protein